MVLPEYECVAKWEVEEDGHVLVVRAVTGRPPRTIGKVRVSLDLEAGAKLEEYYPGSAQEPDGFWMT